MGEISMQIKSRTINLAVHIHKDQDDMTYCAAKIFAENSRKAIAEKGSFTIALSGGITPIPLFRLLSSPEWIDQIQWDKVSIYWVDERCVNPEHPRSNYGMARRELLSHVPTTLYYRFKGELDPEEAAKQYEILLRDHFNLSNDDIPCFDFILLGMSADGHTGSIFPESAALFEKKRLVIDQYVKERNADRLTLTLPVINNAKYCMFLVTGKEKHTALANALDILAKPTLPTQFVRPTNGTLIWMVDEAAATGK